MNISHTQLIILIIKDIEVEEMKKLFKNRFKKQSSNRSKYLKKRYIGAVTLLVVAAGALWGLVGCGDMSEEDVVARLTTNLNDNTSYLATGVMEVESEGQIHRYNVEVGFAQPNYFRVTMENADTGNEQIILKNDDGVFVLTPSLNKQFKFQSDWPETSSQVYLIQSLLTDILNAETTVFEVLDDHYRFTLVADYHANGDLVEQVINFDRKYLTPSVVVVNDAEGNARLTMQFDSFEWNNEMGENFFVADSIMELAQDVMGENVVVAVANVEAALLYPFYTAGADFGTKRAFATTHGERVIMTWYGEQDFTLIQETARVRDLNGPEVIQGEPVMINGSVGAITDTTLTWQRNGVEFFLVSETLDRDQMITVAASVESQYDTEK